MATSSRTAATQKTPCQAAALIQARVRGYQQRGREKRAIRAITALQARQRGRYTRREFQKLLEFYHEQESFLQQSKRRQLRLWHREQELYLLQHTTAEQLDAIRQFQYERGARRIQREWKRLHPTPLEDVDVSGLGRPFDPFGFAASGPCVDTRGRPRVVDADRAVVQRELFGELPATVETGGDSEKLARRRAETRERLTRLRKEQDKRENRAAPTTPTRRDLYTTLVSLRLATAQRLEEASETYRTRRAERDREAARLSASSRNRVAFLLDETRVRSLLNEVKRPSPDVVARERREFEAAAASWSEQRRRAAWENHSRVLESVLRKSKWHETFVAGEMRDIRRVYAETNAHAVWQWPRSEQSTTGGAHGAAMRGDAQPTAMDRFRFCLPDVSDENARGGNQNEPVEDTTLPPSPLDTKLASAWWRAHATQSHSNYRRLQEKQRRRRLAGYASENNSGTEDALVTPEMLVNPQFYELYRETIDHARRNELLDGVDARAVELERWIQQKVVEIEAQIDVNTRLIVEQATRALQQKARKTKEERAAVDIQRLARGKLGRKKAQDHLAQYFVMVRGRAIRKGKCEECGEQPAVLECKQCEDSLHFCPVCWVQVHATRRRKPHVAIPMAGVVVPPPRHGQPPQPAATSQHPVETRRGKEGTASWNVSEYGRGAGRATPRGEAKRASALGLTSAPEFLPAAVTNEPPPSMTGPRQPPESVVVEEKDTAAASTSLGGVEQISFASRASSAASATADAVRSAVATADATEKPARTATRTNTAAPAAAEARPSFRQRMAAGNPRTGGPPAAQAIGEPVAAEIPSLPDILAPHTSTPIEPATACSPPSPQPDPPNAEPATVTAHAEVAGVSGKTSLNEEAAARRIQLQRRRYVARKRGGTTTTE